MPISTSNIKFSDIQTEFGGTNPISLSEYYNVSGKFGFGITGISTSGQISINNFKGKSKAIVVTISGTNNTINNATDNNSYKYALFANNGTFVIDYNIICDILVIGGGGGGANRHGSGGGAGALIYQTNIILNKGTYTITIGSGGSGNSMNATNGNDTFITLSGTNIYLAKGGGGGLCATSVNGIDGGSGSGGNGQVPNSGGNPVSTNIANGETGLVFGNAGGSGKGNNENGDYWAGGGGGGAGGIGSTPTIESSRVRGANGGIGRQISITGTPTYYAGGGGGGVISTGYERTNGGLGGGGGGGISDGTTGAGDNGTSNTGGGGGGGGYNSSSGADGIGGNGGSGIVIIRYNINKYNISTFTSTTNNFNIIQNSSLFFNYNNYYNINSGTYNIIFSNGTISINSTPVINDKSYPILKNVSGNNINPILWYKFDGSSTNMLLDSIGTYNLTNNGATFDTTNFIKGNGSVNFNHSSSQYLSVPSINLYNIQSANGITFSVWFRMNTTNTGPYPRIFDFTNGNSSSPKWILLSRYSSTDNRLNFDIANSTNSSGNRITTNNYIDGNWHHVIWSINNVGNWTIYIDGTIAEFTATLPTNINIENITFTSNSLGKSLINGDGYLSGNIDDFRIYNQVLTQSQVTELYNGRVDIYTN